MFLYKLFWFHFLDLVSLDFVFLCMLLNVGNKMVFLSYCFRAIVIFNVGIVLAIVMHVFSKAVGC